MAGEIQLNSTTMATESSGSITAELDTIRPNATNGSLTLQGDSSDSGVTGLTIDSSGNATFAGTANNIGTVTAGTIGGGVAMASSGATVRNVEQVALSSDQSVTNSTTLTTEFSPTYTPKFSGSKVQGLLTYCLNCRHAADGEARKQMTIAFSGSGITNVDVEIDVNSKQNIGIFNYNGDGMIVLYHTTLAGPLMTTSTTDVITADVKLANQVANASCNYTLHGDGTNTQTFMTWIEYK
jgi:hypothetical protein